jgi:hypothetical protein
MLSRPAKEVTMKSTSTNLLALLLLALTKR